jgi:hypothetical protein
LGVGVYRLIQVGDRGGTVGRSTTRPKRPFPSLGAVWPQAPQVPSRSATEMWCSRFFPSTSGRLLLAGQTCRFRLLTPRLGTNIFFSRPPILIHLSSGCRCRRTLGLAKL